MQPTEGAWEFKQEPRSGDCGIGVPGVTGIFIECYGDIRQPNEFARKEAAANARLVCAAKELLAAAERALYEAVADSQDAWYEALSLAVIAAKGSEE